jgi:hypothetical protein
MNLLNLNKTIESRALRLQIIDEDTIDVVYNDVV